MGYKIEKSLMRKIVSRIMNFKWPALFVVCAAIGGLSPAVLTAGDNGPCIECHTKSDKLKTEEKTKINPITGEIKIVSMLLMKRPLKQRHTAGKIFFA